MAVSLTVRNKRADFGDVVRVARVLGGWTQAALGRNLGCSADRIFRIERGHTQATPEERQRLVDLLGITDPDHAANGGTGRPRRTAWWIARGEPNPRARRAPAEGVERPEPEGATR